MATATSKLRSVHEKQLNDGINNDKSTAEIVKIMGGIDVILTNYLNVEEMSHLLNENAINHIHAIITKQEVQVLDPEKNDDIDVDDDRFYYSFDPNNTFLSSTFSKQTGNRIKAFFTHKVFTIVITLSVLFSVTKNAFCCGNYVDQTKYGDIFFINQIVTILLIYTLWIPYIIFGLFSVNKTAFKLVIKSFEFHFKMYYVILGFIFQIVWSLNFSRQNWMIYNVNVELEMFAIASNQFVFAMLIVFVAFFDGLRLDRRVKLLCSGFIGIFTLYESFLHQFELYGSSHIETVNFLGFDIEVKPIRMLADRIVGIFLIKQFLFTLFKKNKTALIQVKPIIKWTDDQSKNNTNIDSSEIEMNEENDNAKNATKDSIMLEKYVSTDL